MVKMNKRKLDYFIEDEKSAVKEYHKYGLHSLERDEAKHLKYLIRLKKKGG